MSSTNKTTHYDLSQYTANDKPTYLVDYNSDMSNIDTGIYNAQTTANESEAAIGTLSNLTTTDKSSLVNAINEVDGNVDTISGTVAQQTIDIAANTSAIGNLANLETTNKTNLVSAVNEVDSLINKLNLTNFDSYTANDFTTTNVSSISGTLNVATNDDGSVFKVYSSSLIVGTSGYPSNISVQTKIRPTNDITIAGAGTRMYRGAGGSLQWYSGVDITITTTGLLTIQGGQLNANTVDNYNVLNASLYFAKDFGDVPTPTPNN